MSEELKLAPATEKLVDHFAAALKAKLADAEQKYGHGTSWQSPDWMEKCQADLARHVEKGDPRDVAAYCAFMWYHGWNTRTPDPIADKLAEALQQLYDVQNGAPLVKYPLQLRAAMDATSAALSEYQAMKGEV